MRDDEWPKVIIRQDFLFSADGPTISIGRKQDDQIFILGFDPEYHMPTWTPVDKAGNVTKATMSLPDDCARALLTALLNHYQGAPDVHKVREDLLHERGRVDHLIDMYGLLAQSLVQE